LREIVEHSYYVSATPAVEYHEEHRRAVKETPLDRLLLETDSPVVYRRGTDAEYRASPASVSRVLKWTAALLGITETDLARLTTANAMRLFGLSTRDGITG
jgi:TatD DNase family protein